MARKRDINELSADELYELARQREKEEKEFEKESVREEIAELEAQKKEIAAEYKAAIGELDKALRKLRKKAGGVKRATGGGNSKGGSTTGRVLELIGQAKSVSSKDIKNQLEAEGIATKYLAQTLASLKRQGKIASAGRGVYKLT